jgi:hypothetical protein
MSHDAGITAQFDMLAQSGMNLNFFAISFWSALLLLLP